MNVIGLISGTSVDGIDAALVRITGDSGKPEFELVAGETYAYPPALRSHILEVCAGKPLAMAELAALDEAIAYEFAQAALKIQQNHPPADLIGSHGQTVFHRPRLPSSTPPLPFCPPPPLGYSLQLGRGDAIAYLTKIDTVSNFRAADIAAGGQGAPMVSAVDACLLRHPTLNRCIQNIGGISNVTYLPAAQPDGTPAAGILGWDTGPGNTLLDLGVQHFSHGSLTYDKDGAWAASGVPCHTLVLQWLQDAFFHQPPPKSTGREVFGWDYFRQRLKDAEPYTLTPADFLATLTEFTAASIAQSYQRFLPQMPDEVYLCGGGSRNGYLKHRLQVLLEPALVLTTDDLGMNADFKEAIAFAVLAYWQVHNYPGNLPEVTGAERAVILGEIHLAPKAAHDRIEGNLGQSA